MSNEPILFHELENRAEAWHVAKFGRSRTLPGKTYAKLLEEVGELGEALMHGDREAVEHELGDVVHVLMHLARSVSGPGRLLVPALKAIERCEERNARPAEPKEEGE